MKKRLILFFAAILAVSLMTTAFTACTDDSSNSSPQAVVKAFYDAYSSGNVNKILNCIYFENMEQKEEAKGYFSEGVKTDDRIETRNYKAQIDGNTARVTFEYKYGYYNWAELSIDVIRVKGKWYIPYDYFNF